MVAVVQLVRASDCGSECRGFESHLPPIRSSSSELLFLFPPISQARSRAHPARSRAHPTHSQAHPTHSQAHPAHSQAHPTHSRAHLAHSRAHPVYIQAPYSVPPPSSPQDAEAPLPVWSTSQRSWRVPWQSWRASRQSWRVPPRSC